LRSIIHVLLTIGVGVNEVAWPGGRHD